MLRIEKQTIDNNQEHLTVNFRLLDNLKTYINEDQIIDSINRLNRDIGNIESTSGPSKRTLVMRSEVDRLASLLAYIRQQAGSRETGFSG